MKYREQLNEANNPGNARWCPEHDRLECKCSKKYGGQCHSPAVRGTSNCKRHAGHRAEVAIAKGEARITAWTALGKPEPGTRIDAGMAVMGLLQQSWLRAAMYGELLRRQVEEEGTETTELEPDTAVQKNGLIGYKYGAAGKEGHIYATNEEVRALVGLEAAERDRAVRFAKVAHDMGISDRLTSLAERWGDLVVGRILMVMQNLDLTPQQEEKVPELIQAYLGVIDVTAESGLPEPSEEWKNR
jgi:hypothetical protein